jgi:uracil-DNA glycosylase family 4
VQAVSHWKNFLPDNAIVMGKRKMPREQVARAETQTTEHPEIQKYQPLAQALRQSSDPTDSLEKVAADLQGCMRCKLCEKRKTIVVGEGNPQAELVFVGEGPGEQEDQQGRPFVGKSGQLLDRMIEAMGLKRSDVFICNVVKCRPPDNRNPEADEIEACGNFLARQLDILRPKVVVALGKFAAQTLLQTETPISRLRGEFRSYRGAKLMPTFHPAYLLRNPDSKKEAWADLQQVAKEMGIQIPQRK